MLSEFDLFRLQTMDSLCRKQEYHDRMKRIMNAYYGKFGMLLYTDTDMIMCDMANYLMMIAKRY